MSDEKENQLPVWIFERRSKMSFVSGKLARKKRSYNSWRFKTNHNLLLRRQTSVAQKDPDLLTAKIV